MTTDEKCDGEWEAEFDAFFDYTDFGGQINCLVLVANWESYDTEETTRERLKSYVRGLLAAQETAFKERVVPGQVSMMEDMTLAYGWNACRQEVLTRIEQMKL